MTKRKLWYYPLCGLLLAFSSELFGFIASLFGLEETLDPPPIVMILSLIYFITLLGLAMRKANLTGFGPTLLAGLAIGYCNLIFYFTYNYFTDDLMVFLPGGSLIKGIVNYLIMDTVFALILTPIIMRRNKKNKLDILDE